VKMMVGEELSSTDLRLANGDTLLVGQVAEVEQVDALDASAVNRPHYRKLQVNVPCRSHVERSISLSWVVETIARSH